MTHIVETGYTVALVCVSIGIFAFAATVVLKLFKGQS
jgi:hypothetical protein